MLVHINATILKVHGEGAVLINKIYIPLKVTKFTSSFYHYVFSFCVCDYFMSLPTTRL